MRNSSMMVVVLAAGLSAGTFAVTAEAGGKNFKGKDRTFVQRDCTPINGRFGYYGNPWCDTGSYRLEDTRFASGRERFRRIQR